MSRVDHELDHHGDVILVLEAMIKDEDEKTLSPHDAHDATDATDATGAEPSPATTSSPPDSHLKTTTKAKIYRYRVSSRHLCLASPVFRSMLEGPWKESPGTYESPGEVKATDWDPEAMLTLLRIVHGRHRAVAKSLTVNQLCNVAILVDYYKCHEAVEPYTDHWLPMLSTSCPNEFNGHTMLYLFISAVFRERQVF